jgi:hypothetical protein
LTAVTSSTSEQVAALLAPYLGPFNARMWVKAAARRDLGLSPEELKTSHLAALADGLRPSLEALMGRAAADDLLQQILHEVR